MARRYSRDNRGRFASGGTGATARGGRLKTASGKTRATQTMQAGGAKASGAIKGKVKRNPDAAGKVGKAKAVAKPANKQRKTRQQKAEQTARIQATATKASTNPAVSKSRALRNEQRAIRARKLNAIYKSPPIVEMSRGQKDRMIRVRREFGVKSTAQSPNFGSKTAAAKPAKAASKVDTSMSGLARRRARANAPKNSTYLSQKLNTRSAITRSAANAIYNEQRKGAKTLFDSKLPTQIAKAGLIGKGLSGSKRERAEANREAARKRVLKGKRR
jgi:hypothetical protein